MSYFTCRKKTSIQVLTLLYSSQFVCFWWSFSWESKGTPPMSPSRPRNKALIRPHCPLIRALLGPYFLGGVALGEVPLASRDFSKLRSSETLSKKHAQNHRQRKAPTSSSLNVGRIDISCNWTNLFLLFLNLKPAPKEKDWAHDVFANFGDVVAISESSMLDRRKNVCTSFFHVISLSGP